MLLNKIYNLMEVDNYVTDWNVLIIKGSKETQHLWQLRDALNHLNCLFKGNLLNPGELLKNKIPYGVTHDSMYFLLGKGDKDARIITPKVINLGPGEFQMISLIIKLRSEEADFIRFKFLNSRMPLGEKMQYGYLPIFDNRLIAYKNPFTGLTRYTPPFFIKLFSNYFSNIDSNYCLDQKYSFNSVDIENVPLANFSKLNGNTKFYKLSLKVLLQLRKFSLFKRIPGDSEVEILKEFCTPQGIYITRVTI